MRQDRNGFVAADGGREKRYYSVAFHQSYAYSNASFVREIRHGRPAGFRGTWPTPPRTRKED